jgi:hypothetical protein
MPGPNPTEPTTILVLFSGSCIIKVKRKNSAREQDVKMLERCIVLDHDCALFAGLLLNSCQETVSL